MNTTTSPETRAVALAGESNGQMAPMQSPGNAALMLDPAHLQNMLAVAELMSTGVSTVPQHLRKNRGDCLAVVMQAVQWGMNPFAVAQKTHLVNGTLGYEAQLVSAVVNTSKLLSSRLDFEWFGPWEKIVGKFKEVESRTKKDDNGHPKKYIVPAWEQKDEQGLGVRVWATIKGENKQRLLELLMTQARTRNSTLWTEDPKQQLAYLAEKRWARLHTPDVLLGVYTPDELDERTPRDMGAAEVVKKEVPEALLKAAREAADKGRAAFADWWAKALPPERGQLVDEVDDLKARTQAADAKRTVDNPATTAEAKPKATPPADQQAPNAATVLAAMEKATTVDALDIAADWIKDVADEAERAPLTEKYTALRAKFD